MKKQVKKLSINKVKVAKLNQVDTLKLKGGSTFCGNVTDPCGPWNGTAGC